MGEVVYLNQEFTDLTAMLNHWWKELERKPFGVKPARIRHLVETAHGAGWTVHECYEALRITWGFTEAAFETALRRIADEKAVAQQDQRASIVASIEATRKKLDDMTKESLSLEENIKRLRELRRTLK